MRLLIKYQQICCKITCRSFDSIAEAIEIALKIFLLH